ncbi:hypothetical protein B296_00016114 [Ensete ventricosum]|uniref:Uncharacterized protein n=1 Tax=Ensete ventricosum TaxID=4639 RepID=A0A426YHD8_ENSVE|nr:hypothetical protein B296_00016114 [Ensete ventricosum]
MKMESGGHRLERLGTSTASVVGTGNCTVGDEAGRDGKPTATSSTEGGVRELATAAAGRHQLMLAMGGNRMEAELLQGAQASRGVGFHGGGIGVEEKVVTESRLCIETRASP